MTDVGNVGQGAKISCMRTIFMCTTNLGQDEIVQFAADNCERCYGVLEPHDIDWIQKELVSKTLRGTKRKMGVFMRFFKNISKELQALVRRIDCIAPFLPLAPLERAVVADTELRRFLGRYRDPPVEEGPRVNMRLLGNLVVHHDPDLCESFAEHYQEMEGASSLLRPVKDLINRLTRMEINNELANAPKRLIDDRDVSDVWFSVDEDGNHQILLRKPEPEPRKLKIAVEQEHENVDVDSSLHVQKPSSKSRLASFFK